MYENGTSTRRAILDACIKLFYEKGYHETSYDDICHEAHVNRGSIYYHFKEKERLRYEITWEAFAANRQLAEKYCAEAKYRDLLALYMQWHQCLALPTVRQFCLTYSKDYPIFDPNFGLPRFYQICYEHIFNDVWEKGKISSLAFASVYGHLVGIMQLACEYPQRYRSKELYMHAITTCTAIWGIPEAEVTDIWKQLNTYIDMIPAEEIEAVAMQYL